MKRAPTPRPAPPPCRVEYEGFGGRLMFKSSAELAAWKAEPFWRVLFGLTAYDRRVNRGGYQPDPIEGPMNPPPRAP